MVPPAMGTAIGINFEPTGDGRAAATGDFVLTASEVNSVPHAVSERRWLTAEADELRPTWLLVTQVLSHVD